MKLHLGCGSNILNGWVNLDLSCHPGVLHTDLTQPLKFLEVDFIYSQHFIEHLDEVDGFNLLKECYRVLKSGGVMRICCPDLEQYVKAYLDWDNQKHLSNNNQMFSSGSNFLNYAFLGESVSDLKFLRTKSRNEGHKYHYDFQDLSSKLHQIGFTQVEKVSFGKSKYTELCNLENRITRNLIVEAVKT